MNDFSLYSVYVVRLNNGTTENLGVFAGYLGAPNIKPSKARERSDSCTLL